MTCLPAACQTVPDTAVFVNDPVKIPLITDFLANGIISQNRVLFQ